MGWGEWRSADEPPKLPGTYLICTKYGQVSTCFFNFVRDNSEPPFWMGYRGAEGHVVAWMPAPAPPPEYQHFVSERVERLRSDGYGEHAN